MVCLSAVTVPFVYSIIDTTLQAMNNTSPPVFDCANTGVNLMTVSPGVSATFRGIHMTRCRADGGNISYYLVPFEFAIFNVLSKLL